MNTSSPDTTCPACGSKIKPSDVYCPKCGYCTPLAERAREMGEEISAAHAVGERQRIGRYEIIRSIGKGGMGEVFLVWDPMSLRYVALKRILPELRDRPILAKRFLREAWLTSRLAHPAAIPIYEVHTDGQLLYYTMPYVKGRTLREMLRDARKAERGPSQYQDSSTSIPGLIRVFVSLAQVIAYAHSQGILHRDLKPENIMVGDFGEVYVLDWGLAKAIGEPEELEDKAVGDQSTALTKPGKLFGTIAYMAPERVLGFPASELSDVYALGVVLYQILCLRLPFKRGSAREFRRTFRSEVLVAPSKRAPYRNVPHMLERIVSRCLEQRTQDRYQSVAELIYDLENYLQGRSEWFHLADLDLANKDDWEFQENIYLARDTALTGATEITEWVNLMVSKRSFPGNLKVTTRVKLGASGAGIGLLLSIPEPAQRELPDIGYCLWLSGDPRTGSKLIRSGVDVLDAPEIYLKRGQEYELSVEKVENSLYFSLNGERRFAYISYLPLGGTHVGIMVRDADYSLAPLSVDVGSYSIKVNCLAVPDAFLEGGDYPRALAEYRRIGYSFPQRDEGREAKFRAGITLLQKAKTSHSPHDFDAALEEFETLHETAGAPLEYLGKSLAYAAQGDNEEEVKCFQLAFRRYRQHPLLPVLQEQVTYRMHESSRKDRWAAYRFVLLCAQLLPDAWESHPTKRLVARLVRHWEPLPFIAPLRPEEKKDSLYRHAIALQLAFWLNQPLTLVELCEELSEKVMGKTALSNSLFALLQLGHPEQASRWIPSTSPLYPLLLLAQEGLDAATSALSDSPEPRVIAALMESALGKNRPDRALELRARSPHATPQLEVRLNALTAWAHLLAGDLTSTQNLFDDYPLEMLNMETSLLNPVFGCWLAAVEGKEIAHLHFAGVLETPYPRSYALLGHYLSDPHKQSEEWLSRCFDWERDQLNRLILLFNVCSKL